MMFKFFVAYREKLGTAAGRRRFNTLSYAKLLTHGAVSNADTHAEALAYALSHNLYTRDEVDQMLDTTSRRFDERAQRNFYANIGIISTLIVIMPAINALWHH